jgi:hypothetical protein
MPPALVDQAKNSSNAAVSNLGYIKPYNLTKTCVSLTYAGFFIAFSQPPKERNKYQGSLVSILKFLERLAY